MVPGLKGSFKGLPGNPLGGRRCALFPRQALAPGPLQKAPNGSLSIVPHGGRNGARGSQRSLRGPGGSPVHRASLPHTDTLSNPREPGPHLGLKRDVIGRHPAPTKPQIPPKRSLLRTEPAFHTVHAAVLGVPWGCKPTAEGTPSVEHTR